MAQSVRRTMTRWMLGACLLALGAEQVSGQVMTVPVLAGQEARIELVELWPGGLQAGAQVGVLMPPLHGALAPVLGGWSYQPLERFWSLGSDSLAVGWYVGGELQARQEVWLVAAVHGTQIWADDFEAPVLQTQWQVDDPENGLLLSPEAALSGLRGLEVPASGAGLRFSSCDSGSGACNEGGGETGGGTVVTWRPPLGRTPGQGGDAGVIVLALGSPQPSAADVRARVGPNEEVEVAASALERADSGSTERVFTPWVRVGDLASSLRLDVWVASESAPSGGLRLWVDDLAVASLAGLDNAGIALSPSSIGSWPTAAELGLGLELDSVSFYRAFVDAPPVALARSSGRFADGFEDGTLAAWTSVTGAGTVLQVTSASALAEGWGLLASLGAGAGRLERALGTPVSVLNTRLRVDARAARPPQNAPVKIFAASSTEGAERLELWLRQRSGSHQLQTVAIADGGTRIASAWQPLTSAVHDVEIQWRAATGAATSNGLARLWIDGKIAAELVGIDSDGQKLDEIAFGTLQVPVDSTGSFRLDDLQAWW